MSDFVDVRRLMVAVLRSWWLIALVTIVAAAIGYGASRAQPSVYAATTTLLVGKSILAPEPDSKDFQTSQQLAKTYADIARRRPVLQSVINTLGLNMTWSALKQQVSAQIQQDTQLLEIKVDASSPTDAQAIVDEIAHQLILISPTADAPNLANGASQRFLQQQIDALQTKIAAGQAKIADLEAVLASSSSGGLAPKQPVSGSTSLLSSTAVITAPLGSVQVQRIQDEINALERSISDWQGNYARLLALVQAKLPANYLTVIEPAQIDASATRPNIPLNTTLAGGVGLALALGFVLVREGLDNTLRSEDDLSRSAGLTCLGTVAHARGNNPLDRLITVHKPLSARSEAYQIIRSNIQSLATGQPAKSIMVTGLASKETMSMLAANLGVAMAQSGFKVIVLDTDLRQPLQHQIFEMPRQPGLTDLLGSPDLKIGDCLRTTCVENLKVITSGTAPTANPAELLSLARMQQLLADLRQMADVIICDGRPVLAVADATVLSIQMDGVLFAVEAGKTRQDKAEQALSHLRSAGAKLLGGVLILRMGTLRSVLNAPISVSSILRRHVGGAPGEARAAISTGSRSHI